MEAHDQLSVLDVLQEVGHGAHPDLIAHTHVLVLARRVVVHAVRVQPLCRANETCVIDSKVGRGGKQDYKRMGSIVSYGPGSDYKNRSQPPFLSLLEPSKTRSL